VILACTVLIEPKGVTDGRPGHG